MRVCWERDVHQAPNRRTVLRPDVVLVPERHSKLARLESSTGEPMWVCDVSNTWGWPCVVGDGALYLNQYERLQCHDLASGDARWQRHLGRGIWGFVVALEEEMALVGGWRGYTDLCCLSMLDGSTLWRRDLGQAEIAKPVIVDDMIVLAFPSRGRIEFVDRATGMSVFVLPFASRPGADDHAVLVAEQSTLYCCAGRHVLRLAPGSDHDWIAIGELPHDIVSIAPTITAGVAVVHDAAGNTAAFTTGGKHLWTISVPQRGSGTLACQRASQTILGTQDGRAIVVNADGTIEDQQAVTQRITSALSPGPQNMILFTTKGTVMALDATNSM